MTQRQLNLVDNLICSVNRALFTLSSNTRSPGRASPAMQEANVDMSEVEQRHAAGLMRVNHAGEVCAQALYQGQALTAKLPDVRKEMEIAAEEEVEHLAWCEDRLRELEARPSLLNPLWYSMSFGIGAAAGLISDKVSLGFVAATEEQVCKHLQSHLESLPDQDARSRAVVKQMLIDEEKHGHAALDAGGLVFPAVVKAAMTAVSKLMTFSSYRV